MQCTSGRRRQVGKVGRRAHQHQEPTSAGRVSRSVATEAARLCLSGRCAPPALLVRLRGAAAADAPPLAWLLLLPPSAPPAPGSEEMMVTTGLRVPRVGVAQQLCELSSYSCSTCWRAHPARTPTPDILSLTSWASWAGRLTPRPHRRRRPALRRPARARPARGRASSTCFLLELLRVRHSAHASTVVLEEHTAAAVRRPTCSARRWDALEARCQGRLRVDRTCEAEQSGGEDVEERSARA